MDARRALLAIACALLAAACDVGSVPPPQFPDARLPDAGPTSPDAAQSPADAGQPAAFAPPTTTVTAPR